MVCAILDCILTQYRSRQIVSVDCPDDITNNLCKRWLVPPRSHPVCGCLGTAVGPEAEDADPKSPIAGRRDLNTGEDEINSITSVRIAEGLRAGYEVTADDVGVCSRCDLRVTCLVPKNNMADGVGMLVFAINDQRFGFNSGAAYAKVSSPVSPRCVTRRAISGGLAIV